MSTLFRNFTCPSVTSACVVLGASLVKEPNPRIKKMGISVLRGRGVCGCWMDGAILYSCVALCAALEMHNYTTDRAMTFLHFSNAAYCSASSIANWTCSDCLKADTTFTAQVSDHHGNSLLLHHILRRGPIPQDHTCSLL